MNFTETPEQTALRSAASDLGRSYGYAYYIRQARSDGRLTELWQDAAKLGFLGVNLPEDYGGGGAGMYELAIVLEELAAAGCGLLMMVVSPAICGTILARFGTRPEAGVAAEAGQRVRHHGVRNHRARRRLQLAQAVDGGQQRRGRLGTQRPQDLHLRRRRGRGSADRRADR